MLVASLTDQAVTKEASLQDAVDLLWSHPQVVAELVEMFGDTRRADRPPPPTAATHPDAPLQIHARYSRIEILAAMGLGGDRAKLAAWQSGVYEARPANAELFAFTLDKSSGGFSPTTRYRDYAISRTLIHWESQAATREDSPTGLRYRHHERDGRTILLFTRLRADDRAFWFLGPATYQHHSARSPWPSLGSSMYRSRATFTPPSPQLLHNLVQTIELSLLGGFRWRGLVTRLWDAPANDFEDSALEPLRLRCPPQGRTRSMRIQSVLRSIHCTDSNFPNSRRDSAL